MTIESIQSVAAPEMFGTASASASLQRPAQSFTDWLQKEVANVNDQLVKADDGVRRLALGEADNLHQVMINLEQAKLSFELVVQIRNKLLDAYQELMRMQV